MNNPAGIYHYRETLCNDPDKDFEILDYVSIEYNSESLEQPTPSLLSKYSTSNTEIDINIYDSSYDIQFDTSAIGLAKAYANSSSTTIQEQDNEIDINWLAQDLDRCHHLVEKLLKQLGGILELDFDAVDKIVMKSKGNSLNTLEKFLSIEQRFVKKDIYSVDTINRHHDDSAKSLQLITKWINEISESAYRDIQCLLLHKFLKEYEFTSRKSMEEKETISTSLSFLGVKITFRLKKVNVRKLSNSEIYCDVIKRNPKQM
ncbi:17628_t:CDS:2, partial [Racocetra persica]